MTRSWFAVLAVAFAALVPTRAFAGGPDAARQTLQSAGELYASGNWDTAREAYADAFEKAPPGSLLQAEADLQWAQLLWEQGEYVAAEQRANDALQRAKKLHLDQAVGRLMLTLGHIEASRGKLAKAEGTLRICVRSARQQHDTNFEVLCRINLRFVRELRGRRVSPESQYRRDLKILEASGQNLLVGTALAKAAELQEKAGDLAGALATLREAHKKFRASKSLPAISRNRLRLTQALQNLGKWKQSATELHGLVLTFENMHNRPALITAHALRGKQRAHDGNASGAQADLRRALSLATRLGSPQIVANAELALCEFWANAGESKQATRYCNAAHDGFQKVGVPSLAARSQILLARQAQAKKQWLPARAHYVEALDILQKIAVSARDRREIAVQQVNLCQVEIHLHTNGAHHRCLAAAHALDGVKASDASFRSMVAATKYAVGVTAPDDHRDLAMKNLEQAAQIWQSLGNPPQAADALLRLGKLQADDASKLGTAIATFDRGLALLGNSDAARAGRIGLRVQKGQALLGMQTWDAAAKTLKLAIDDAEKAGDDESAAWAYSALARAELKLGHRDAAVGLLRKGLSRARKAKDKDLSQNIEKNLKTLGKNP